VEQEDESLWFQVVQADVAAQEDQVGQAVQEDQVDQVSSIIEDLCVATGFQHDYS
jgi:hypothetical protein